MEIKQISAKEVKNSRNEKTIQIILKTEKGTFITSAPSGKSRGKHEVPIYKKSLQHDIKYINNLNLEIVNSLGIDSFEDLEYIERLTFNDIGGNTLFVLEANFLKALAKENKKELWKFLGGKKSNIKPIGNAIGGGLHSKGIKNKKPDFQEFLFIASGKTFSEKVKINEKAYNLVKKFLKAKKRNDEGAWETELSNEEVLEIMDKVRNILKKKKIKIDIGLDIAGSSFYNKNYNYKNPVRNLTRNQQIDYLASLIKNYNIFYIEDPLNEHDFKGFKQLLKETKKLITGDDLTTTNLERVEKAIKSKSISGIIIKPNQIGSLLETKQVIDLCKKNKIKTIISHRSGETLDNTIADLAIGFGCDFIKTGIYGKVRKSKLNRLIQILKN